MTNISVYSAKVGKAGEFTHPEVGKAGGFAGFGVGKAGSVIFMFLRREKNEGDMIYKIDLDVLK